MEHICKRVSDKAICLGYHRFQSRVVRMLSSLVNTGQVDFLIARLRKRKSIVPEDILIMVEKILDAKASAHFKRKCFYSPAKIVKM